MTLQPTIRLRLTAWYAGMFLACGALLLGASYVMVREQFEPRVEPRGVAQPADQAIELAERPADVERRVREEERRRDEEALADVLGWFAAILGLLTVGSVGIGWLVAGRALAPVSRITETARRVSGRRLHERIALDGPRDELRELADTFDAMLARLDAAFDGQRRFVANASHELRTPLAIIRAELEELGDSGALRGEQQAMVANARRAAARSERLIASLLTLARSDAELRQGARVDLGALVRHALAAERCARIAGVEVHAELRPVEVAGDPILLESLVTNLVENGLRHNHPGGRVDVATHGVGEAALVVSNTGPVLDAKQVARLFDPFARGPGARASEGGGSGLGLSIVQAVVSAHHGDVTAVPRDGGGLVVTVRLPLASAGDGGERGETARAAGQRA